MGEIELYAAVVNHDSKFKAYLGNIWRKTVSLFFQANKNNQRRSGHGGLYEVRLLHASAFADAAVNVASALAAAATNLELCAGTGR